MVAVYHHAVAANENDYKTFGGNVNWSKVG